MRSYRTRNFVLESVPFSLLGQNEINPKTETDVIPRLPYIIRLVSCFCCLWVRTTHFCLEQRSEILCVRAYLSFIGVGLYIPVRRPSLFYNGRCPITLVINILYSVAIREIKRCISWVLMSACFNNNCQRFSLVSGWSPNFCVFQWLYQISRKQTATDIYI